MRNGGRKLRLTTVKLRNLRIVNFEFKIAPHSNITEPSSSYLVVTLKTPCHNAYQETQSRPPNKHREYITNALFLLLRVDGAMVCLQLTTIKLIGNKLLIVYCKA